MNCLNWNRHAPSLNNWMSWDISGCQNWKAMANTSFIMDIVSHSTSVDFASIFQSTVSKMYSSQTFMCLLSGLVLWRDSRFAAILIAEFNNHEFLCANKIDSSRTKTLGTFMSYQHRPDTWCFSLGCFVFWIGRAWDSLQKCRMLDTERYRGSVWELGCYKDSSTKNQWNWEVHIIMPWFCKLWIRRWPAALSIVGPCSSTLSVHLALSRRSIHREKEGTLSCPRWL